MEVDDISGGDEGPELVHCRMERVVESLEQHGGHLAVIAWVNWRESQPQWLWRDGFSKRTCLTARMVRMAYSKCKLLGKGIKTASIFGSSRISVYSETGLSSKPLSLTHPRRMCERRGCSAFRECRSTGMISSRNRLHDNLGMWEGWCDQGERSIRNQVQRGDHFGAYGTHAIWAAPRMPKRIASFFFSTFGGPNAVKTRIIIAAIVFNFPCLEFPRDKQYNLIPKWEW